MTLRVEIRKRSSQFVEVMDCMRIVAGIDFATYMYRTNHFHITIRIAENLFVFLYQTEPSRYGCSRIDRADLVGQSCNVKVKTSNR